MQPTVPLLTWVMVELLRDRKDQTRERASVREAGRRLEQQLARSFVGGRRISSKRSNTTRASKRELSAELRRRGYLGAQPS